MAKILSSIEIINCTRLSCSSGRALKCSMAVASSRFRFSFPLMCLSQKIHQRLHKDPRNTFVQKKYRKDTRKNRQVRGYCLLCCQSPDGEVEKKPCQRTPQHNVRRLSGLSQMVRPSQCGSSVVILPILAGLNLARLNFPAKRELSKFIVHNILESN